MTQLTYNLAYETELDGYYAGMSVDTDALFAELDRRAARQPNLDRFVLKALTYELAAEQCDVHVFRHMPFYFELEAGRGRFQWGFGGVGAWFRENRKHLLRNETDTIHALYDGFFTFNGHDAAVTDLDHHSLDFDAVLEKGLDGLAREAEGHASDATTDEQRSFCFAAAAGCRALIRIADKFSQRASTLLERETDPVVRANLTRIATSSAKAPAQPAQTFYEALNTLLFTREIVGSLEGIAISTYGHLDRMLYPYYQRDLAAGRLTPDEAHAWLVAFLRYTETRFACRRERHETSTTIVLGGCNRDGNIIFNELTRAILDIYREWRLIEPKLHVRMSKEHPRALAEACAELLGAQRNVLALFNDDIVIAANVKAGRALEDARLYIGGGCQENKLQNCEINSRASIYMNTPKLLQLGFDPACAGKLAAGERLRLRDFSVCPDFERFYAIVMHNARELTGALVRRRNRGERKSGLYNPCPLLSALTADCLARGKDITEGGARYSVGSVGLVGLATLIDSLTAVRTLVFEEQRMGLAEFARILAADFSGHEPLRQYILGKLPKHGGEDPATRRFAARVFADLARATSGFANARGGKYEASLFSHMSYLRLGHSLPATPDGRRAGAPLSKGIGPSFIFTNQHWSTGAVLDSLGEIDFTDYPEIGVLDLRFPAMPEAQAVSLLVPVIERFLNSGGPVLQINVLDTETLKKAQTAPEQHKDLIVRVSGFSANFVTLGRDIQDEVIARSTCCWTGPVK